MKKPLVLIATLIIFSEGIFAQFNSKLAYGSVKDIDNNTYKTIQIGRQIWMAENLRTTKYSDGSNIPIVTDIMEWENNENNGNPLQQPMMCWYDNDQTKYTTNKFGALYNWYAINPSTNGNKNVCPTGWHVPNDAEWDDLIMFLDPLYKPTASPYVDQITTAGRKMKSTGTQYWLSPNKGATNSSGFSGLPGGNRNPDGQFYDIGQLGEWWSSTEYKREDLGIPGVRNNDMALSRYLANENDEVYRTDYAMSCGLSVRCIRY
jgi:uncharacterized protein (TIGR02145 family)